jgi:hypothetical protein
VSRRTIRDDERVVAELHRLLGVLPADERPMPDIHIDKDAMYARLMAKFDAEEQQARQLAAATAHARRHDRGGLGWFVAPRWVTAAAAAVVISALVMVLDIGRAPIAHAATPQLLLYSLTDAADIYTANPARETLVTLQRRADAGRFTPATVAASVQYVAVSAWLLAWPTDETDRTVVQPTAGQRWLAADGSARTAEFRGAPLGLDGRFDATLPESAAGPESSDDFPAGTFDATTPSRLPRDRAALRQALISTMAPIDCASTPGQATSCLIDAVRALYAAYVIPEGGSQVRWDDVGGVERAHRVDEARRRLSWR